MRTGKVNDNTVKQLDLCINLKSKINTALAMIDMNYLGKVINGDMPVNKSNTYMLTALFMAMGLIRFSSAKGRKVEGRLDAGIDRRRLQAFNDDQIEFPQFRTRISTGLSTYPDLSELISKIKHRVSINPDAVQGTVVLPKKPDTFGADLPGAILDFSNTADPVNNAILYYLCTMLDTLNRGDYGPANVIEAISKHIADRKRLTVDDIHKYIINLENIISAEKQEEMIAAKNCNQQVIQLTDLNKNMTPYGFQWAGINWHLSAKRGINAFETGLGKTLMAIVTTYCLIKMKKAKGAIIFTELSVINGWKKEINNIWPDASVTVVADVTPDVRISKLKEARNSDFVVFSYGPLTRGMPDVLAWCDQEINRIVFFDEGGKLKNTQTHMHESAKRVLANDADVKREYAIILDATPYPNDVLVESHNLINGLLYPNQLGTMRAWKKKYVEFETTKVNRAGEERELSTYTIKNLEEMRKETEPFIFRKEEDDADVNAQLPKKRIERIKYFTMGAIQSTYYQHAMEETLSAIIDVMTPGNEHFKDSHFILGKLVRLRQSAISPWLYDKDYTVSKDGDEERLALILDILEKWINEDKEKGIKRGILVGAEFVSLYDKLKPMIIKRLGFKESQIPTFTGKLKLAERLHVEEGLNNGYMRIALFGYKAGGKGLNLQKNCSRVLIAHETWNPAIVEQFISRVDRQGQKRRVKVYTLRAEDTIDEGIAQKVERKLFESREILNSSKMQVKKNKMALEDLIKICGIPKDMISDKLKSRGLDSSIIDNIEIGDVDSAKDTEGDE